MCQNPHSYAGKTTICVNMGHGQYDDWMHGILFSVRIPWSHTQPQNPQQPMAAGVTPLKTLVVVSLQMPR